MRDIRYGITSAGLMDYPLELDGETIQELKRLNIPVEHCDSTVALVAVLLFNNFTSTSYPGGFVLSHPRHKSCFNFHL